MNRDDPYDIFGEQYAEKNRTGPCNALYERPALLALLGDQNGHEVLDLGCGPGPVSAAMLDDGATVTGLDRSHAMLTAAEQRLGGRATLLHHELNEPLPFPDAAFDTVAAGLVLHYLPDWSDLLAEIRRVTRPGARIVASVHHPFNDRTIPTRHPAGHRDYLASYPIIDQWHVDGVAAQLTFWHHPLGRMTSWITSAGLELTDVIEPRPLPAMLREHPDSHARLSAEPAFLLLGARHPTATI